MQLHDKSALSRTVPSEDAQASTQAAAPLKARTSRGVDDATSLTLLKPTRQRTDDNPIARQRMPLPKAFSSSAAQTVPAHTATDTVTHKRPPTTGELMNQMWYSSATRRKEFGPLRDAFNSSTGQSLSGGKFLAKILDLTKSSTAKPFDSGQPLIKGMSIKLPGTEGPVHVLYREAGDGTRGDLRVTKQLTGDELQRVTMDMVTCAAMGRSMKMVLGRGAKLSRNVFWLWRDGSRKNDFGDLHLAYKEKVGDPHVSGPSFLDLVHKMTTAPEAKPATTSHPDIFRFALNIPGTPDLVHVLRRLDGDGELADLRVVPPGHMESYVLVEMASSLTASRAHSKVAPRTVKPKSVASQLNQRHWGVWRMLEKQFKNEYEACRLHAQKYNKPIRNGSMYVRHLEELCEKSSAVEVDPQHRITRHTIVPDGCSQPITVLLRKDETGIASMRKLGDGLTQQQARDAMVSSIRNRSASTRADAPVALAAAPLPPAKRPLDSTSASSSKKPRLLAPSLIHAFELKQALEQMLENKRHDRPALHGMDDKTGVSVKGLRSWFNQDGSLSSKRKSGSFFRLKGYFELRDDLHDLFMELRQFEAADSLPQQISAKVLGDALRARVDNPQLVGAAALARIAKAHSKVIETHIDARTGLLLTADSRLCQLPDYAEHRLDIAASLRALGQVERADALPSPETPAETFVRSFQSNFYRVAAAINVLARDDKLSLPEAATRLKAPRDLLEAIVGPHATIRSTKEIADRVPGLDKSLRRRLVDLVQQLELPPSRRMTRVLVPRRKYSVDKIFLVNSGNAAPGTTTAVKLSQVFAHSPDLVMPPRSYKDERKRQTLRWLSTTLKTRFKDAVEIQSYFDPDRKEIWVSSNKVSVNEQLHGLLAAGGLKDLLANPALEDHASREGRHAMKLQRLLADASSKPHRNDVQQLVEAMTHGRFRVPMEIYDDDGKEVHFHAERRLKKAIFRETGKALDARSMAGTMRPCGICADELDLPRTARRGPFWLSPSAQAYADMNALIERDVSLSTGTYATKTRLGVVTVNYNTDSDSDVESGTHARKTPEAQGSASPGPAQAASQHEREIQELHRQAEDAGQLLKSLGIELPFDVPVGEQQTQQVLQQLLDEGSRRFKRFLRQLERDDHAQPKPGQAEVLAQISARCGELRRSSAHVGWLPQQASPTHALPAALLPSGDIWSPTQVERLFNRGQASGTHNICWFDTLAQLKLHQPRGQGGEDLVDHLALRLRQAADCLGLSGQGEMFDDGNGAMHVIARALGLQVHTFRQQGEGLGLSQLQTAGSGEDPAVYVYSDDLHFVPMWLKQGRS